MSKRTCPLCDKVCKSLTAYCKHLTASHDKDPDCPKTPFVELYARKHNLPITNLTVSPPSPRDMQGFPTVDYNDEGNCTPRQRAARSALMGMLMKWGKK